jgi:DNA-binding transcriptional LysR family regulator
MNNRFQELAVFVRVGESGGFSRAARDMNLSQPSVSRVVGELEARLGVQLLLRSTRRLTLTPAGEQFLERAREILAELENAENATRGLDSLRGTIRMALPVIYGTRKIIPCLEGFLDRHPLLNMELRVSDTHQDLVAEGVDIAIRMGKLRNSPFGARKLATLQRFLVAAPAYLAARGTPKTPACLATHDCIFGPNSFGRESWTFRRYDTVISVKVTGRIHVDSGPGMLASAVSGLGVAMGSAVMCGAEIGSGALVPLLPNYTLEPVEVHAVFPGGPRPSAKVSALAAYLAERLNEPEPRKPRYS